MPMTSIHELFEHELNDMYAAEHRLVDALHELAEESSDRNIKKAFQTHRRETQGHIKRLDRIFKSLGVKPGSTTCPGIEGLIKEKKAFSKERPSPELLDFFNVGASQKVERYEITAYEGLIEMAEKMGHNDALDLLEANLQEEEATLQKLKTVSADYDVEGQGLMAEEEDEEEPAGTPRGR